MLLVLGRQVHRMCKRVDLALTRKCRFVRNGMYSFTFSMVGSLACLMYVMVVGVPAKKDQSERVPERTSLARCEPCQHRMEMMRPHLPAR
jgi:hypothetical protein